MVDLITQYDKIKPEVDAALADVISQAAFINGPEVKAFQAELERYLAVKHVIPCANGTDALQVAMMALDLQPGDEVITATFTYVATAEVIALLKLTPVLVDVDPETFLIDPAAIEAAITPKTKAIVPIHLFGQCANMDEILRIAKAHNLYVIEDTAQAIGAAYTFANGTVAKAGTMGTIGATVFFQVKI
jgi:dTDP-4-amino-4,6-dideoxygalactose transaminase